MSGPFRFLDPEVPVTITRGHLPHWDQEGATYFITWRLADSIPKALWEQWQTDRSSWLRQRGIDARKENWRRKFESLPSVLRREFSRTFSAKVERELDSCHGECLLRDEKIGKIVSDSLQLFDGGRYTLGDYVIMPNHVHVLVGGLAREAMLDQVTSWKKWTALQINRCLARQGRLW